MPNLASSPHHTLLLLTGLALTGFLALTYLAFHQPTSVLAANASIVTSDTMVSHQNHYQNQQHQQPKHHNHQADGESASSPSQNAIFKSKSPAKSPVSSQQNSRLVNALLVMGGLGCH
ncbi:hypothetical protein I6J32_07050 [Moraxella osloensis]|nr:hypothetical protein [Moraxella osloensis]QRO12423.1 hypothetical protein I6J32_07050 [Moraxella osloensis]